MNVVARRLAVAVALLGASACFQGKVSPKPQLEVVAALELQVDAPGMSPEDVEQSIVAPIELALVGNSDIRTIVSEAREGQARIQLSLSNRAELVAVDVLQRVTAIQPQLPEDAEFPVLRPRDLFSRPGYRAELNASTLHFSLTDEHAEAAQALLRALEATPGVREVSRCGPVRTVTVELDPEAMRRMGVTLTEVERAARSALLMPPEITAEELLDVTLPRADGSTIELGELATVRAELATDGCKAYTQTDQTTGVSVTVAHAEARANVAAQLDAARERGVVAQRFDSRLHVWLTPATEHEQVLERVRASAGADWMLEVGVEAEPCAGPGTLARLHTTGAIDVLIDSLAAIPGVALVEHPDNPRARRWLMGPDLDVLARLGGEAAASAGSVVLLDGELTPEQVFELDREKLAAYGLDVSAVALTMAAALDGLELSSRPGNRAELSSRPGNRAEIAGIRDAGAVMLRLGGATGGELGELPIAISDGQTIPLASVAELRREVARARICRRNGERGVVLLVRPQDVELPINIELPADYSWAAG